MSSCGAQRVACAYGRPATSASNSSQCTYRPNCLSRGLHWPDYPKAYRSAHLVPEHLKHVKLLGIGLCKAYCLQTQPENHRVVRVRPPQICELDLRVQATHQSQPVLAQDQARPAHRRGRDHRVVEMQHLRQDFFVGFSITGMDEGNLTVGRGYQRRTHEFF